MRPRKKKILGVSLLVLVAALAALRLALPAIVTKEVNAKLAGLEGYQGQIDGVDISLLRGAYAIRGLRIDKRGVRVPFLSAESIGFSVVWSELLHRRILASVDVVKPRLNVVKGLTPETSAAEPNESFATTLRSMTPFDIDRFEVEDGEVHYRDFDSEPPLDLALTKLHALAVNLTNHPSPGVALPVAVDVKGKAFETGNLALTLKLNPLKEEPTFEVKHSLSGVELTRLNDFLDAYAKVRVKKGVFQLYAEAAAKDGKFVGFAEPFFKDLVIEKRRESAGRKVWAVVASAVKWILSNKKKKQVATKIPIEGTFEKSKAGLWAAAGGVLKNAYIKALTPTVENLKLKDVEKVEAKDKEKNEDKDKDKEKEKGKRP